MADGETQRDQAAVYGGDRLYGAGNSQRYYSLSGGEDRNNGKGLCGRCGNGKLAADPAGLHGGAVYYQRTMAVHCFDSVVPVSGDRYYPVEERLVFGTAELTDKE